MMAAIFVFSSIPSDEMPNFDAFDYIVKKGGHAFGYGLLGLSYLRGLKGKSEDVAKRWFFIAWAMAVLFSTTDEFHQSFVPGRHPAIIDVLIDTVGAATALLIYYKLVPVQVDING